jgi:hypothetical protein
VESVASAGNSAHTNEGSSIVRVYTLTILTKSDEVATGLARGTYVAHVSDDAVTIMFKPEGKSAFRVGRAMEEEK